MTKKQNIIYKYLFLVGIVFLSYSKVPAQVNSDSSVTIVIDALAGLQFDKARFVVKPGTKVRLVFANTDDMSHNLIITKPGTRVEVVEKAQKLGEAGVAQDYIPKTPQVLWAIPAVAPNEIKTIIFTAPQVKGIYPYVCTFPGHGYIMYGAMYVTSDATLPPLKTDQNIPLTRREEKEIGGSRSEEKKTSNTVLHPETHSATTAMANMHPYPPVLPSFYRVYIDGASPAAIVVGLPIDISYCWDAGTGYLRFAWQGGFVDNSELWKGKGDVSAKIIGTVFFKDKSDYPLRVGKPDKLPEVKYKGFKLINRYPEFHYTIDGTEVFELIRPKEDGTGLVRTFKIPSARKNIWFSFVSGDGVLYEASAGKWESGKLKVTPAQAKEFTLTMTKKKGVNL